MFQNPDKDCKVSDDMKGKKNREVVKHRRPRQRFRASNFLHVLILPLLPVLEEARPK